MSNFSVNQAGMAIACRMLIKHGLMVEQGQQNFVTIENEGRWPLLIWTKVYQKRKITSATGETVEHDITGKDEQQMNRIKQMVVKHGDVVLCWVDAVLGCIKFGRLSKLMQPKVFERQVFPHTEVTHSGKIVYFNVHLIPSLCLIEDGDLEELRMEIWNNRNPKDQTVLDL